MLQSPLEDSELESWALSAKRMGVILAEYICDITIHADLDKTLQQALVEMPPVHGVIQAAMMLKDIVIYNMTYTDLSAAVRPKVLGSSNLHNTFLTQRLDFSLQLHWFHRPQQLLSMDLTDISQSQHFAELDGFFGRSRAAKLDQQGDEAVVQMLKVLQPIPINRFTILSASRSLLVSFCS
ncbi:ketoreductase domain-containing protein [Aspergillus tanneri]|uniref:Polyketide synthase n=1 Tax=Aspergillus tanneri TaxID=1220188 RepID=A0A5M9MM53_9EURO|nr:polyketide synthase [Aspergillus tanneri]KAA8643817.1 polyketide synthase [Aspergillus tanneri]